MKIDLVYLWVDGAESKWLQRRNSYLPIDKHIDVEALCEGRTANNDELRYSLRSAEMYAPWINHIYIITDAQCPEWLDRDNPRISIVDHRELLPTKVLPLYNSCAIELGIHKIKGLSEHYIYANDDTMFARTLRPEFFFGANGRAICRFVKELESSTEGIYNHTIKRVIDTIVRDFGDEYNHLTPHHQIDAYTKSCVEECINRYSEWCESTIKNRFRSREDMQRHILSLYAVATGRADAIIEYKSSPLQRAIERVAILLGLKEGDTSKIIPLEAQHIELQLRLSKPALICFNDSQEATPKHRAEIKSILERLYPVPSQFEKR